DPPAPAAANADALHDLANGASGLSIVFAGSPGAFGYGVPASETAIARALEGVHLGVALDLDPGAQAIDVARSIAALAKRRGMAGAATGLRFGLDPIGAAAVAGGSTRSWSALLPTFNAVIV